MEVDAPSPATASGLVTPEQFARLVQLAAAAAPDPDPDADIPTAEAIPRFAHRILLLALDARVEADKQHALTMQVDEEGAPMAYVPVNGPDEAFRQPPDVTIPFSGAGAAANPRDLAILWFADRHGDAPPDAERPDISHTDARIRADRCFPYDRTYGDRPFPVAPPPAPPRQVCVTLIDVAEEAAAGAGGSGIGRLLVSTLKRLATIGLYRSRDVCLKTCYLRSFIICDSQFGFYTLVNSGRGQFLPQRTPPARLFQAYLTNRRLADGSLPSMDIRVEREFCNKRVAYSSVDLIWAPPIRWALAAYAHLPMQHALTGVLERLDANIHLCDRLQDHQASPKNRKYPCGPGDTNGATDVHVEFLGNLDAVMQHYPAAVRVIGAYCRELHNLDLYTPSASTRVDFPPAARAAFLQRMLFDARHAWHSDPVMRAYFTNVGTFHVTRNGTHGTVPPPLQLRVLLEYLVDMGRALQRPVCVDEVVMRVLIDDAFVNNTANARVLFDACACAVYPLTTNGRVAVSPLFIWLRKAQLFVHVPQKKPRVAQIEKVPLENYGTFAPTPLPALETLDPALYNGLIAPEAGDRPVCCLFNDGQINSPPFVYRVAHASGPVWFPPVPRFPSEPAREQPAWNQLTADTRNQMQAEIEKLDREEAEEAALQKEHKAVLEEEEDAADSDSDAAVSSSDADTRNQVQAEIEKLDREEAEEAALQKEHEAAAEEHEAVLEEEEDAADSDSDAAASSSDSDDEILKYHYLHERYMTRPKKRGSIDVDDDEEESDRDPAPAPWHGIVIESDDDDDDDTERAARKPIVIDIVSDSDEDDAPVHRKRKRASDEASDEDEDKTQAKHTRHDH
jgi:hypothetical protein